MCSPHVSVSLPTLSNMEEGKDKDLFKGRRALSRMLTREAESFPHGLGDISDARGPQAMPDTFQNSMFLLTLRLQVALRPLCQRRQF